MFPTQSMITVLADRIHSAYSRRYPLFAGIGVSSRVWEFAATGLLLLHARDRSTPLDPELFVMSQPNRGMCPDPWAELTPPSSIRRYRQSVRRIVRRLRSELKSELRRAERRLIQGEKLDQVLESSRFTLSPLGCYVLAHRTGRSDLIDRYRYDAEQQHLACPLYRQACLSLLPYELYPEPTSGDASIILEDPSELDAICFSLN